KIRELFAVAADGRGGNRENIDVGSARGILEPARDLRRIVDRRRVRHAADRSESAGRRSHRTAGDGLFIPLPRLAQMHMDVDQAWRYDQPARVEAFIGFAAKLAGCGDLSDAPVLEQKIVLAFQLLGGIDEETTTD